MDTEKILEQYQLVLKLNNAGGVNKEILIKNWYNQLSDEEQRLLGTHLFSILDAIQKLHNIIGDDLIKDVDKMSDVFKNIFNFTE